LNPNLHVKCDLGNQNKIPPTTYSVGIPTTFNQNPLYELEIKLRRMDRHKGLYPIHHALNTRRHKTQQTPLNGAN
jgi:hypothetical protein